MKQASFRYDFGIEGEFIRRNLRIYGKTNIEFDYADEWIVFDIRVETFVGATPVWEQIDFDLPHHGEGVYEACEQHLEDL